MTALVVRGDARRLPLPDASVDLVVTSPPYFALRSYIDDGQHYPGQIGSEATPQQYLEALWTCTEDWVRVLKSEGSIWVNLGDKYAQNEERSRNGNGNRQKVENVRTSVLGPTISLGRKDNQGVPTKSLMGIPWRYAIGCIDRLGLILRAELIWSKVNGLPESVTDRVRRSHEQWFHLVKQPRYYAAVDEIREAYEPDSADRKRRYGNNPGRDGLAGLRATGIAQHGSNGVSAMGVGGSAMHPLGKLPGSVWSIPSEPLTVPPHLGVDHFAAFPTEWPRRLILGWSPPGICTACGQGRQPVIDSDYLSGTNRPGFETAVTGRHRTHIRMGDGIVATIAGYACACPEPTAPTRPSVIVDPFGGTGTTALVAHALGRVGITVDMSGDYSRLAKWRCTDRGELAKALRVPKPPPVPDGQINLFEEAL